MKKLRACIETAIHYVKKRAPGAAARDVRLVHSQFEDEEEHVDVEDENVEELFDASQSGPLVVRSISGQVVHTLPAAGNGTHVMDIVNSVCENTVARADEVRLVAGDSLLEHQMVLGRAGCVDHPGPGETLEISVTIVAGPPVTATSLSGTRIEVMDRVPDQGDDCHFDRDYAFSSLGDFDNKEGMHYIMTCNDDRKTSAQRVMWQLDIREEATIYINFRSERHIHNGGALAWLERDGWELKPDFKSTVSDGYPNGPYSGPVYAKTVVPRFRRHVVDLMGSNYWEGTYFVFVQLENSQSKVESFVSTQSSSSRVESM